MFLPYLGCLKCVGLNEDNLDRFHCLLPQDKSARVPNMAQGRDPPPPGLQEEKNRKIFGKIKDILFLSIGFL